VRRLAVIALLALVVGCAPASRGRLVYPAIGLDVPVVTGLRPQVDAGYVVDYGKLPGIWLAGHRTTHGAVFHNSPTPASAMFCGSTGWPIGSPDGR